MQRYSRHAAEPDTQMRRRADVYTCPSSRSLRLSEDLLTAPVHTHQAVQPRLGALRKTEECKGFSVKAFRQEAANVPRQGTNQVNAPVPTNGF